MTYPTAADIEIVEQAAQSLDEESLMLRMAHTKPPAHTDWDEDLGAKESHDAMKGQVRDLYALAARMRAAFSNPDPLSQALNEGDGTYRP